MNTNPSHPIDDNNLSKGSVASHNDPLIPSDKKVYQTNWKKSIVISAGLIFLLGGSAFVLGRHKQRPIDWVHVNANEKQDVILPDGSKIVLRKGSALDYPSDFGKSNRNVNFKGEAHFDILPYPSFPFIVSSINGKTTNYGKSFYILSNDSLDQVFVLNGRVRFENNKSNGESLFINSGQKGEIYKNKITSSTLNSQNFFSWESNRLIFNKTPLYKVIEDINNFYGIPVRFAPDVNPQLYFVTGVYNNQKLEDVLLDISSKTDLIIQNENGYVLLPNTLQKSHVKKYTKDLYITDSLLRKKKKNSKIKEWANNVFSKPLN